MKQNRFLTFTLSFLVGWQFSLPLWLFASFGESKFLFLIFLAGIPTLPRSAPLLCAVVRFEGLFAAWLTAKLGPYGVWTERDTPESMLLYSDTLYMAGSYDSMSYLFLSG